MAYAESTISGAYGGNYRVWVNSIRTWDGGPSDNTEDWRVEGGLNKIGGTSAFNNYNQASYTLQLGLNGVASSGNFNYSFSDGQRGTVVSWGTGATKVYRNSAGEGFGFQSRMDINLANGSALGSGWVTSNDSVQTRYRHASLTALSTDAGGIPFTDEGPAWLEFANPAGAAVDAWLEAGGGRIFTSGTISSRYNYVFNSTLQQAIQQASPNSNTFNIRIGVHDSMGGDNWDWRDRTGTIKNDTGQANPNFSNFTYKDTNAATVAVTGSDQILIQGRSTLEAKITTANKATPNKFATMSTYNFSLGGYSQNATYSSSTDVVQTIGTISDVTGVQNLSARAVDSRGNSKTVTKAVTILPYNMPGFFYALTVKYDNEFDSVDGIKVEGYDTNAMIVISPMTYSGVDKNQVNTTSGVQFDIAKGSGSFSGTWTNIAITQEAGTGMIRTNLATLGTSILTRMNALGADNTVPWYVKFKVTDALETRTYTVTIDVGRPIFRIGTDGNLYHKETEFHEEFSNTDNFIVPGIVANAGTGTFGQSSLSGFPMGYGCLTNTSVTIGDYVYFPVRLNAGTYTLTTSFVGSTNAAITEMSILGGIYGSGSVQFTKDNYFASTTDAVYNLTNMPIDTPGVYIFKYKVTGKNASSTSYMQRVIALKFTRTA